MDRTEIRDEVRSRLLDAVQRRSDDGESALSMFARSALVTKLTDDVLREDAARRTRGGEGPRDHNDQQTIRSWVLSEIAGRGRIDIALQDPTVEEVVAPRFDYWLTYHGDGTCCERPDLAFQSDEEMRAWLAEMARTMGRTERQFNRQHPLLVMRIGAGLRLAATCDISQATTFALRRNTLGRVTMGDLVDRRMFPPMIADLLTATVRAPEARVVIVGATGAGKTTLSRALLNELPRQTRLCVIEDTAELDLFDEQLHPNVESWEAREPNSEGKGEVTLGDLVKHGLRYRPDLLILGETRDADAAVPMLKAMTHGQASLTTVHAETARDGLDKLALLLSMGSEAMTLEKARYQLSRAVDFVVHVDRGTGGARFVTEVLEVANFEGDQVLTNPLFASSAPGVVDLVRAPQSRARKLQRGGFDVGRVVGVA